jgi:hypothetical protein
MLVEVVPAEPEPPGPVTALAPPVPWGVAFEPVPGPTEPPPICPVQPTSAATPSTAHSSSAFAQPWIFPVISYCSDIVCELQIATHFTN